MNGSNGNFRLNRKTKVFEGHPAAIACFDTKVDVMNSTSLTKDERFSGGEHLLLNLQTKVQNIHRWNSEFLLQTGDEKK